MDDPSVLPDEEPTPRHRSERRLGGPWWTYGPVVVLLVAALAVLLSRGGSRNAGVVDAHRPTTVHPIVGAAVTGRAVNVADSGIGPTDTSPSPSPSASPTPSAAASAAPTVAVPSSSPTSTAKSAAVPEATHSASSTPSRSTPTPSPTPTVKPTSSPTPKQNCIQNTNICLPG